MKISPKFFLLVRFSSTFVFTSSLFIIVELFLIADTYINGFEHFEYWICMKKNSAMRVSKNKILD